MSSTKGSLLRTEHLQFLTLLSFASHCSHSLSEAFQAATIPSGRDGTTGSLTGVRLTQWECVCVLCVCAITLLNSKCCTLIIHPDNASGFERVTTITMVVASITTFCPTLLPPHGLYIALQIPLSMGFPRQEYWRGLSFPSPEDLSNPGIKPTSFALAGRCFTTEPPGKPITIVTELLINMSETMPSIWLILTNSLHTLTLGVEIIILIFHMKKLILSDAISGRSTQLKYDGAETPSPVYLTLESQS